MEAGDELNAVMGDALEAIRIVAILASPAMPRVAEEIWRRIGLEGHTDRRGLRREHHVGSVPKRRAIEKGEPLLSAHEERRVSHWTDAHCHLQDHFLGDDETTATLTTTRWRAPTTAGVDRVVVIGTDATTSAQRSRSRTSDEPRRDLRDRRASIPTTPSRTSSAVLALARTGHPKLVGIGECGLDYFYEHSPRTDQREPSPRQIALAHELDLALVIHARDAFDDLFDLLRARACRRARWCTVSPARPRTPGRAGARLRHLDLGRGHLQERRGAARGGRGVPLERLHVETDSPFLAPVPYRGGPTNRPTSRSSVSSSPNSAARASSRSARRRGRIRPGFSGCPPLKIPFIR